MGEPYHFREFLALLPVLLLLKVLDPPLLPDQAVLDLRHRLIRFVHFDEELLRPIEFDFRLLELLKPIFDVLQRDLVAIQSHQTAGISGLWYNMTSRWISLSNSAASSSTLVSAAFGISTMEQQREFCLLRSSLSTQGTL